jgi:hypothetical protein
VHTGTKLLLATGPTLLHRGAKLLLAAGPMLLLTLALAQASPTTARCIARYADGQLQAAQNTLLDYSGFDHHATLAAGARLRDGLLDLSQGYVSLPAGERLFGPRAARGAVAFWVRPAFDPQTAPFAMFFYCMQTDSNGWPDGYDEIGLYLDHGLLRAKVAGSESNMPFASLPAAQALAPGRWAHLALSCRPGLRALYLNGRLAVHRPANFEPPRLDAFPAELARHPSSRQNLAPGEYAPPALRRCTFPGASGCAGRPAACPDEPDRPTPGFGCVV